MMGWMGFDLSQGARVEVFMPLELKSFPILTVLFTIYYITRDFSGQLVC